MKYGFATLLLVLAAACATPSQTTYATPENAVDQLITALRADDTRQLEALLGPGSDDLVHSGDDVADRNGRERFVQAYDEKHALEEAPNGSYVLYVGNLEWPVPIPIVRTSNEWRWDTAAGREEILDRRIGRNELNTIQVCLAYCDAQYEYAGKDRNGDGLQEYARKFLSTEGKQDGLYWPTAEGEPLSPLGALAAQASAEGYRRAEKGEAPRPFHGYHFRILTGQGEHAPGGAYSYLAGDRMIGGFALIAWPAEYEVSGVMTFVVNQDARVYQKDLGPDTEKAAAAIQLYDPDSTWTLVKDDAKAE